MMALNSSTRPSIPARCMGGMVLTTGITPIEIVVSMMRRMLRSKTAADTPGTSLVPSMMIATVGITARYSQASGDSPAKQFTGSAFAGFSTAPEVQPTLAASDELLNELLVRAHVVE